MVQVLWINCVVLTPTQEDSLCKSAMEKLISKLLDPPKVHNKGMKGREECVLHGVCTGHFRLD